MSDGSAPAGVATTCRADAVNLGRGGFPFVAQAVGHYDTSLVNVQGRRGLEWVLVQDDVSALYSLLL